MTETAPSAGVQPVSAEPVVRADPAVAHVPGKQWFWLWVLCLTGVDYFSTLAYQPSIAFEATGRLAPLATLVLILITLGGAVPIYRYVAGKSPHGQGSIAMLEHLLHGWGGKLLVLLLLGFAATDFVITITLSAADASEHLLHNPLFGHAPGWLHHQERLTMLLLISLGALFLRGFREVIGIAVVLVALFLLLNGVVIVCSLVYLANHPELVADWLTHLRQGDLALSGHRATPGDWGGMILLCLILFPKLALGLSGFETGVAVMPLIRGRPDDTHDNPQGRIEYARRLLLTSAVIMSVLLMGSALVTTILIPPAELQRGGDAANRALAFLAHGEGPLSIPGPFGEVFGTLYDLSTVSILWFAGASALSGLLTLIPRYPPRFGMAPEWATAIRPLVLLLTGVSLFVTAVFKADVEAQGGAYATGVMVLITSACVAVAIDRYRGRQGSWWRRLPWLTLAITAVFLYTTIAILIEKPEGAVIAACFIGTILVVSLVSRVFRSTELRFQRFEFVDEHSRLLWQTLQHLDISMLVPHRPGIHDLEEKETEIRRHHHLGERELLVFVEVRIDDASEFLQTPLLEVRSEEERFVIGVTRCASIAHVLAALALELSRDGTPPELHFGWSDESPLRTNLRFLLFGEGNVPWMVRSLLIKAQPDPAKRPRVVIG